MKSALKHLLVSLAGLIVMILSLSLRQNLPELALKFMLFGGCILFGYGLANIFVEKNTPKNPPE